MTPTDYQTRAAYCRQMAARAMTDDLRTSWLETAEMWLQMATPKEPSSEGAFRAAAAAGGTGRWNSETSH